MAQTATIDVVVRTIRRTMVACLVAAVCALTVGSVSGHGRAGLSLGIGLALGSLNGLLVRRSASVAFAFGAVSLARLALLTLAALGISLALGLAYAWLILLGLALAQLLLVAMAAQQALHR